MSRPGPQRWCTTAAVGAAVLLVSGCGLVGVRLSDEPGGPVRVGAQSTMGPEPEPTETADPALEGLTQQRIQFSGDCPTRLSLHVPDDWTSNTSGTSFNAFPNNSDFDGPRLSVYCSDAFADSASEAVSSSKQYQFTDTTTDVIAENLGQVGPGYSWTYEADLGPDEAIASFSSDPTTAVGASVAYPISGKVYELRISYYFATDDADMRADAIASVKNAEVEGSPIGSPSTW